MNENGIKTGDVVRGSHELLESAPTTIPRPNVTNKNGISPIKQTL